MSLTNILIIVFLIVIIIFNIWNAVNLYSIKSKPARHDALNDSKYWELKFKIQFLVASFSVVLALVAFLGYNTLDNIKDSISENIKLKLDSTKLTIENLDKKQQYIDGKMNTADAQITKYQNIILGLSNKQLSVKEALNLSSTGLSELKERINEINSKNILQQNIYIVDEIGMDVSKLPDDMSKTFSFSSLVSISGDKIPPLKKPPFILAISNQNCDFRVSAVTNSTFKLTLNSYIDTVKIAKPTLFITIKP